MHRTVLGGLAVCLTLALSGCGGDDTAANSLTPSPSATSSSATDPDTTATDEASASPTAEESASGDTYASYAPTTGVELTGKTSAVNGPAEWGDDASLVGNGGSLSNPDDPQFNVTFGDFSTTGTTTLDDQVRSTIELGTWDDSVERLDDVVVAGNPAYHVAGRDTAFLNYIDEIGFELDGRQITVRISTARGYDPAQRAQLIGSVMASFRITA